MPEKKFAILIVEDDEYLIGIYATKFELEGCEVIKAKNGEQGYKMAKSKKPDIILADIMMPGMNGFEMLEKIKKDKEVNKIPVVILSNLGQNEDIDKGMKLGAIDYIIKVHHTPAEIFKRVSKLLKK